MRKESPSHSIVLTGKISTYCTKRMFMWMRHIIVLFFFRCLFLMCLRNSRSNSFRINKNAISQHRAVFWFTIYTVNSNFEEEDSLSLWHHFIRSDKIEMGNRIFHRFIATAIFHLIWFVLTALNRYPNCDLKHFEWNICGDWGKLFSSRLKLRVIRHKWCFIFKTHIYRFIQTRQTSCFCASQWCSSHPFHS